VRLSSDLKISNHICEFGTGRAFSTLIENQERDTTWKKAENYLSFMELEPITTQAFPDRDFNNLNAPLQALHIFFEEFLLGARFKVAYA
jgi:hypothetical protein